MGHLNIGGWAMVLGYVAAAAMACRALLLHGGPGRGPALPEVRSLAAFWLVALCVLVLLGLNKLFNLLPGLGDAVRDLAKAQGWYGDRRIVQAVLVGTSVAAGLAGMAALAWRLRGVIGHVVGAVVGLGFLVTFVTVRAVSLHSIDRWLGGAGLIRLSWVLELGGLALIALSAWRQSRLSHGARPGTL